MDWITRLNGSIIYMGQQDLPRKQYAALNMGGTKTLQALNTSQVAQFSDVSVGAEAMDIGGINNATMDVNVYTRYFTRE